MKYRRWLSLVNDVRRVIGIFTILKTRTVLFADCARAIDVCQLSKRD